MGCAGWITGQLPGFEIGPGTFACARLNRRDGAALTQSDLAAAEKALPRAETFEEAEEKEQATRSPKASKKRKSIKRAKSAAGEKRKAAKKR